MAYDVRLEVYNESGVIDPVERFHQLQGKEEVWGIRHSTHKGRTIFSIGVECPKDLDRVLHVLAELNAGRGIPPRQSQSEPTQSN